MYRIHQDQSTGTKRSGKFYARAVPVGVMEYDEFCKRGAAQLHGEERRH